MNFKEIKKLFKKYKIPDNVEIQILDGREIKTIFYNQGKNMLCFTSNENIGLYENYLTSEYETRDPYLYTLTKKNGWELIWAEISAAFKVNKEDNWDFAAYIVTAHVDSKSLENFYDLEKNSFKEDAKWETKIIDTRFFDPDKNY